MELLDSDFGRLQYEYGWWGSFRYAVFGHEVDARLFIPCDEGDEVEPSQRAAFVRFKRESRRIVGAAEIAVYEHYLACMDEIRKRVGPNSRESVAPVIQSPQQLHALVKPTEIVVQYSSSARVSYIGMLFDCSWEPQLGLAVKIVDAEVVEVGPQDIVL